ncbi:hypothetical protein BGZ98_008101 [Dissophora globulifera]|nr:hypothetical protein BGZ98_008101 [Dissophora globulifera]
MPRVRSASSNVSINGMSSQNFQHRQQQQQHPNNGDASVASVGTPKLRANTNNGQVPRLDPSSLSTTASISSSSSGTPIAARQPALSLMDIYAHQQHLQQYSNQRAQLTHAQITQMYMMRHSAKSNPSLSSAASTPSSVATSSDVAGGSSSGVSNSAANNIMRTTSVRVRKDGDDDDDLPLIHQQQQKQQRERQRSNEKKVTSPVSATSQQVTVLFEATSHSMQDQENKMVTTVNDSGKDMAPLTIPSLVSETASSIISSVAGTQSADVPGRYPVNSVGGSGAGNAMYGVDAITLEDMRHKS